ncbi:MAG: FAD-binding oxidoreductase [Candidatus Caldarchaeum sp.]
MNRLNHEYIKKDRCDAVVIGGGVVGLLTAYMLNLDHMNVVVVAGKDVKKAASWGNAGYLAAGFGSPIPSAESISRIIKWMITSDSPIKISPKFLITETTPKGWLTKYLKKSKQITSLDYASTVRQLCVEGVRLLKKVIDELKLSTDLRHDGILEVYLSERKLTDHLQLLENNRRLGIDFKHLDAKECLENNPLLSKDVVGGVLFTEDLSLNPSKLILSLRMALAQQTGIKILDEEVEKVYTVGRRVSSVRLSDQSSLTAPVYVICAGVNTRQLLSQLGVTLPIVPAYGYMVMTEPVDDKLRWPIVGGEFRLAMSQTVEGNLRATGFFELRHSLHQPSEKRFDHLLRKASQYVPVFAKLSLLEKWFAARPCTPDGIPYVGRVKYDNLLVAAGHCRLGLTMAASTAKLVADLIAGRDNPFGLLLSPAREAS